MDEISLGKRLAAVANAAADPARASMLCALMDGRAYTATELSVVANVAASTASSHLAQLVKQQMIACVPQGRYRYFRIASRQVADVLESMMGLAYTGKTTMPSKTPENLRFARTCYDHMAGRLAVTLHDRLIELGWLNEDSSMLSIEGKRQLNGLAIDYEPSLTRRCYARVCLDWSERKAHLGGQLGAALLTAFEKQKWVLRQPDSRELLLTSKGSKALSVCFGLSLR
jgi:DNA-binding transcriptional ArsR family regulator